MLRMESLAIFLFPELHAAAELRVRVIVLNMILDRAESLHVTIARKNLMVDVVAYFTWQG